MYVLRTSRFETTEEMATVYRKSPNVSITQVAETQYCSFSNTEIRPYSYAILLHSGRYSLPAIWISLENYQQLMHDFTTILSDIQSTGWINRSKIDDKTNEFVSNTLVPHGSAHCAFCESDLEKNTKAIALNRINDGRISKVGSTLWYHILCFGELITQLEEQYAENRGGIVTTII